MKILLLSSYYKPAYVFGGPVQCFANLCEGLIRIGAITEVLTTSAGIIDMEERKDIQTKVIKGVRVTYYPLTFYGLKCFYSYRLAKAIKKRVKEFDLVVLANIWSHGFIIASRICKKNSIPYVVCLHGQLLKWALGKKPLRKEIYMKVFGKSVLENSSLIHCTDIIEKENIENSKLKNKAFVVPNALNFEIINAHKKGRLIQDLKLTKNARVIIFLGRLEKIKRPDIAFDVLRFLKGKIADDDIHLVLVGPDQDNTKNKIIEGAKEEKLELNVHFTDLVTHENAINYLSDCDLLIMPSEVQENFGMAALEAVAVGTPVIVSNNIPIGKAIEKAGAGVVVPCNTIDFQNEALKLLSNKELLMSMSKAGKVFASNEYNFYKIANKHLVFYKRIIKSELKNS